MRLYIIITFESDHDGNFSLHYHKKMHMHKEFAFEEAKSIGSKACVIELSQTDSWNLDQIKNEEEEFYS
jgi:uncharacterized protein YrrD